MRTSKKEHFDPKAADQMNSKDVIETTKAVFVQLVNAHADLRQEWSPEPFYPDELNYLLMERFNLYQFTTKEKNDLMKQVRLEFPEEEKESQITIARVGSYNTFIQNLADKNIRISPDGRMETKGVGTG